MSEQTSDDELIIQYSRPQTSGIPLLHDYSTRPFKIDEDQKDSLFITESDKVSLLQSLKLSRLSLIERQMMSSSKINPVITHATQIRNLKRNDDSAIGSSISIGKARTLSMSDFIKQKREVYVAQLTIDKKRRKQKALESKMKLKEELYEYYMDKIDQKHEEIKKETLEYEFMLVKQRREAESVTAINNKNTVELKTLESKNSFIRRENDKMEEPIEQYRVYKDFLTNLTPYGVENPLQYFNNPKKLINEFTLLEAETLSLVQQYEKFKKMLDDLEEQEKSAEMIDDIQTKIEHLLKTEKEYNTKLVDISVTVNNEDTLNHLSELIDNVYISLFGTIPVLSPMEKLVQIDIKMNELEKYVATNISKDFVRSIEKKLDSLKKEIIRKKKLDLLLVARNNSVISRKRNTIFVRGDNRKLVERILPVKITREKEATGGRDTEKARLERLLFEEEQ